MTLKDAARIQSVTTKIMEVQFQKTVSLREQQVLQQKIQEKTNKKIKSSKNFFATLIKKS